VGASHTRTTEEYATVPHSADPKSAPDDVLVTFSVWTNTCADVRPVKVEQRSKSGLQIELTSLNWLALPLTIDFRHQSGRVPSSRAESWIGSVLPKVNPFQLLREVKSRQKPKRLACP
jgi:hypothetical protein